MCSSVLLTFVKITMHSFVMEINVRRLRALRGYLSSTPTVEVASNEQRNELVAQLSRLEDGKSSPTYTANIYNTKTVKTKGVGDAIPSFDKKSLKRVSLGLIPVIILALLAPQTAIFV